MTKDGKPILLDLFCGAGGCAKGYQHAGFYVVGVDIHPQPHYCGNEFYQADALEFLAEHGRSFEVIHASPPCQAHSCLHYATKKKYPDLIPATRRLLQESGRPYIIENVERAPLINPIMLCGTMFDLKVFRHRKFEISIPLLQPGHIMHSKQHAHVGHRQPGTIDESGFVYVAGNMANLTYCQAAMGINWMNKKELSQAIPPAYTQWIGDNLMHISRLI